MIRDVSCKLIFIVLTTKSATFISKETCYQVSKQGVPRHDGQVGTSRRLFTDSQMREQSRS